MAVRIESNAEPIPGYRLIERIGGGGFGEVWKVVAPGGLFKAIKFVYGDLEEAGENGHRAEQELKSLTRVKTVRHPYILSLERFDIIGGQLLIVMELADRNLWDRFKECRAQGLPGIPREELLRYMEESAEALDLMIGEYGLQHLDIKPQNLFVVHQHVKVADFGLVKDLEGAQASVTGGVTPVYAAPETFDGVCTRFSDQYSLAIVYQELLTGQRPFVGSNVRQLVLQHLNAVPNLSALPPHDQPIIARALAKKPDDRFPTCREMVEGLRLASGGVQAPPAERRSGVTGGEQETGSESGVHTPLPPSAAAEVPSGMLHCQPQNGDSSGGTTQMLRPVHAAAGTASARPETKPATAAPERERRTAPAEVKGEGVLFPALVVGLGSLGLGVLKALRREITDHFGAQSALPQLRCLLLDTDPGALRQATRDGPPAALTPEEVVLAPLSRPSHYMKARDGRLPIDDWFNSKMLFRIPRSHVTTGVRALGRLAFCDHYRALSRRLHAELEACLDPQALATAARQTNLGVRTNRPRVYVVSSLTGGTGSGMFLDLAYVLRQILHGLGYEQADVVSLLFLPTPDPSRPRTMAEGNAYAALTELLHFASPSVTFAARYHEDEPALRDPEPPFSRCVMLPLPAESDEKALHETAALAAEYLFRDACSGLGQKADLQRAGMSAPSWAKRGRYYQTFGICTYTTPLRALVREIGRRLCQQLVQRWLSKDASPLREHVQTWVEEHWRECGWAVDTVTARLRMAAEAVLGQPVDAAVNQVLAAACPTSALEPRARGAAPRELDPAALVGAVQQIEALVGWPKDQEVLGRSASLPAALEETTALVVNEWGTNMTEMVVQLIEEPSYRLAGAEEALRQLIAGIERLLKEHEPRVKEELAGAAEAHVRLHGLLAALTRAAPGRGRVLPTPEEIVEAARSYATLRFQSLVRKQVVSVYTCLRGQLSDELRELNSCRNCLTELLRMFGPVPPVPGAPGSAAAQANLARVRAAVASTPLGPQSGQGHDRCFYPNGGLTLEQEVETFLASVTPADLLEFDAHVQQLLADQSSSLLQVCLGTNHTLRSLRPAMQELIEAQLFPRMASTNVAELFLQRHAADENAVGELVSAYDEARPELAAQHGGPSQELCVLTTPSGPAGERLQGLLRDALPQVELVIAPSQDDVVLYRELANQPITELPQLGPTGQEAYRQMTSVENFTPHARCDITAWNEAPAP